MSAVLVPRVFRELDERRETEQPLPLQHYFGRSAVVVLDGVEAEYHSHNLEAGLRFEF